MTPTSPFPDHNGVLAQLVAHLHGMQGARGSSPRYSTSFGR